VKAYFHQAPFLLAGVDFEGDSREFWCLNIEQARSIAGQCMGPGDGPPWQGWEIWGNHPQTEKWECLECGEQPATKVNEHLTPSLSPLQRNAERGKPEAKPFAARYKYRRASDMGKFPCWQILTSALASPAAALELIRSWNRKDAGRFVWAFDVCLPDDFDYPLRERGAV